MEIGGRGGSSAVVVVSELIRFLPRYVDDHGRLAVIDCFCSSSRYRRRCFISRGYPYRSASSVGRRHSDGNREPIGSCTRQRSLVSVRNRPFSNPLAATDCAVLGLLPQHDWCSVLEKVRLEGVSTGSLWHECLPKSVRIRRSRSSARSRPGSRHIYYIPTIVNTATVVASRDPSVVRTSVDTAC